MRTIPPPHPCPTCGQDCWGKLCRRCYLKQPRQRTPRPGLSNDWAERKRRADVVRAHRAAYGDWCPGYRRPPHLATRLSADHIAEVHAGGLEEGPLQVLCTSCNTSKSQAVRKALRQRQSGSTSSRPWLTAQAPRGGRPAA